MPLITTRLAFWLVNVPALTLGLLLAPAGRVQAGPLNPLDFASLGAFPTASGSYIFDTSGTPTLIGPGGNVIETGVVSNGIAVFDFDSISVTGSQQFLGGNGALPLALLSRSDASIATGGLIDVSGTVSTSGPPAAMGGPGSVGIGDGLAGGSNTGSYGGGGGGGFGGPGGAGSAQGTAPGGAGGTAYGNPGVQLQGGSSGGNSGGVDSHPYGLGGGGGGAIELGAVGAITIAGNIYANASPSSTLGNGGGGGSGGAIFLHAQSVDLSGWLLAMGGEGGSAFSEGGPGGFQVGAGGGGGGGRVTILGQFTMTGSNPMIDVSGGDAGGAGAAAGVDGVVAFSVPEPAGLVLMSTGILLLGAAWVRGRSA